MGGRKRRPEANASSLKKQKVESKTQNVNMPKGENVGAEKGSKASFNSLAEALREEIPEKPSANDSKLPKSFALVASNSIPAQKEVMKFQPRVNLAQISAEDLPMFQKFLAEARNSENLPTENSNDPKKISQLRAESDAAAFNRSRLAADLEAMTSNFNAAAKEKETLARQIEELKSRSEAAEAELKKKVSERDETLMNINSAMESLEAKLQTEKAARAEAEAESKQNEALSKLNEAMLKQNEVTRKQKETMLKQKETIISRLEHELSEAIKTSKGKETNSSLLQLELARKSERVSKLEHEARLQIENYQNLEAEMEASKRMVTELQTSLSEQVNNSLSYEKKYIDSQHQLATVKMRLYETKREVSQINLNNNLEEANAKLRIELNDLKLALEKSDNVVTETNQKFWKLWESSSGSELDMKELGEMYKSLQENYKEKREQIRKLLKSKFDDKVEINQFAKENMKLKEDLKKVTREPEAKNSTQTTELSKSQTAEFTKLQSKIFMLEDVIENHEAKLRQAKAVFKSQTEALKKDHKQQMDKWTSDEAELKVQIETLVKSHASDLEKQVATEKQLRSQLTSLRDGHKSEVKALEAYHTNIQSELKDEIKFLKTTIDKKDEEQVAANSLLSKLEKSMADQSREVSDLNAKLDESQNEFQKVKSDLEQSRHELTTMVEKNQRSSEQIQSAYKQASAFNAKKIEELTNKLEVEHEKSKLHKGELDMAKTSFKKLQEEKNQMEEKLKNLEVEHEQAKLLKGKLDMAKTSFKKLQEEKNQMEEKLKNLEVKHEQAKLLKGKLDMAKTSFKKLQEEKNQMEEKLKNLEESARKTAEALESEVEDLTTKLRITAETKSNLEEELRTNTVNSERELDLAQKSIDLLKSDLLRTQSELDDLRDVLANHESAFEGVAEAMMDDIENSEEGQAQEIIRDLQQKLELEKNEQTKLRTTIEVLMGIRPSFSNAIKTEPVSVPVQPVPSTSSATTVALQNQAATTQQIEPGEKVRPEPSPLSNVASNAALPVSGNDVVSTTSLQPSPTPTATAAAGPSSGTGTSTHATNGSGAQAWEVEVEIMNDIPARLNRAYQKTLSELSDEGQAKCDDAYKKYLQAFNNFPEQKVKKINMEWLKKFQANFSNHSTLLSGKENKIKLIICKSLNDSTKKFIPDCIEDILKEAEESSN